MRRICSRMECKINTRSSQSKKWLNYTWSQQVRTVCREVLWSIVGLNKLIATPCTPVKSLGPPFRSYNSFFGTPVSFLYANGRVRGCKDYINAFTYAGFFILFWLDLLYLFHERPWLVMTRVPFTVVVSWMPAGDGCSWRMVNMGLTLWSIEDVGGRLCDR